MLSFNNRYLYKNIYIMLNYLINIHHNLIKYTYNIHIMYI